MKLLFFVLAFCTQLSCDQNDIVIDIPDMSEFVLDKDKEIQKICKLDRHNALPISKEEKIPFICSYLYRDYKRYSDINKTKQYSEYENKMDLVFERHEEVFGDRLYPFLTPLSSGNHFFRYLQNHKSEIEQIYKKYGFDLISFYSLICYKSLVDKMVRNNIGYEKEFWDKKGFTPNQYIDRVC